MSGTNRTADLVSIGSIVEYSDTANPPAHYIVVVINRKDLWSPFTLRSVDPATGYSYHSGDLSQPGWTLISA